eukprot:m.173754 g.173754  ORF g.173754 m.173754 type:complete len:564 (-) comp15393_c0_seq5:1484-3175(-)
MDEDWLTVESRQTLVLAFEHLQWRVQNTEKQIEALQMEQETFVVNNDFNEELLPESQLQAKKETMMKAVSVLRTQHQTISNDLYDTRRKLHGIQREILVHLEAWLWMQKLATYNETTLFRFLQDLQSMIRQVAHFLLHSRRHSKILMLLRTQYETIVTEITLCFPDSSFSREVQDTFQTDYDFESLIKELVIRTFVVERQPPQVLKTGLRFTVSIRSLAGEAFNCHRDLAEVNCQLLDENQARVASIEGMSVSAAAQLCNSRQYMQYNEKMSAFHAQFKNVKLTKPARNPKEKTDKAHVWETKFCLLFTCSLKLFSEMKVLVRVKSLPVVVIVHGNQQPNSEATILWDNHFSEIGRVPFVVPNAVPWERMKVALSGFFQQATGAPLLEQHLEFLRKKLNLGAGDSITWDTFVKNNIHDRMFSFWGWLHAITEQIKKFFGAIWTNSLIIGFISKDDLKATLLGCEPGTFAIRFSESALGAVSISWSVVKEDGTKDVWALEPWFSKDLEKKGLADRINDLPQLRYLHPNIPKDDAFKEYFTNHMDTSMSSDYNVSSKLVAVMQVK